MMLGTRLAGWSVLCLMPCSSALSTDPSSPTVTPVASSLGPESRVIEKWHGTWAVKCTRHKPLPPMEVTYDETFEWILDHRYLRSETSRKSDGGMSSSMIWFDILTKSYRFVIYDSSGLAVMLPPPKWNEATQTMEWKSGMFDPVSYNGYANFNSPDTIVWKSLWKDWKGTVILDIDGTSVRKR